MAKLNNDLAIYTRLLPATRLAVMAANDREAHASFECIENALARAVLFDCRQLPLGFVEDTGEAALEEMTATHQKVTLPYDECYFEFANGYCGVAWHLDGEIVEQEDDVEIGATASQSALVYGLITAPDVNINQYALAMDRKVILYPNMDMPPPDGPDYLTTFGIVDPEASSATDYANYLVIGVLALLADKLLLETILPDPKPYLNAKRRAKGKPPISGVSHILTVNVPAVRYAAARNNPTGHHASPLLHWRRGHKRTLPNIGEQVRTTWVRRCLVGDPSKGYAAPKGYRLIQNKRAVTVNSA